MAEAYRVAALNGLNRLFCSGDGGERGPYGFG